MLFPHRCKARRLLALPLLCWALSAPAQSRLTADEAVALALSQPHVLQELDAGVDSARSEVIAARTWSNPELTLSRERGDSGPLGDAHETTAVLSQTFELGGRRGLRRDAAEQGVHAAQLGAAYERARLRGEVLRAYSDVVAAERRQQAHAHTRDGLGDLSGVAAKRQRSGDLSGYESRRIAQASAQAQARAADADAQARTARARLAGLVGETALTAELNATPPLPPLPARKDDEVRSAELEVLQAQREFARAQARAERRPAVPVTVGIGTKRVEEAGMNDDLMVFELGVPLPLFDRNQAGRARSAAEAERADARYQRALLEARSRRSAAWEEARQLSASARLLFATTVPEAEQLTGIARASFAEGELDLVGLLDAYDARTDVIEQALEQQSRALDALLELQLLSPLTDATVDPSTNPSTHPLHQEP